MALTDKIRILFFIGSLRSGGKERRLIELLSYLELKDAYELMVVVTKDDVHYGAFNQLEVTYHVIQGKGGFMSKLTICKDFYRICKQYRPHLVHVWGRMQAFYSLPAVIAQKIPLVNSQVTAAPPNLNKFSLSYIMTKVNFIFSKVILSNSRAGIDVYNAPLKRSAVIYNGINQQRFKNLPGVKQVKEKYGIETPHIVIKVASFTANKDYDLFLKVAQEITAKRDDITFIGVGGIDGDNSLYSRLVESSKDNTRILFPGKIADVEGLVNASTIGVLFTNRAVHGEGISNAILEYMALGKPVIANDAGGTNELVINNQNGYLITNQSADEIAALVVGLIDDPGKCRLLGEAGIKRTREEFTLETMGMAFEAVYHQVVTEGNSINRQKLNLYQPVKL